MHIVIFTGGEAPLPHDTVFYFSHAPVIDKVIAADSGLDLLEAYSHFYGSTYDFKPDLIIGDMDSLKDTSLLQKYGKTRAEIFNRTKDFTDTELALQRAVEFVGDRASGRITLVGGCGGTIDHFISIYDSFSTPFHADFWLGKHELVCCLPAGSRLLVSNVRPDQRISVARLTSAFSGGGIQTEGLEWEWRSFRKNGMPSISNRISDDFYGRKKPVSISVTEGSFLVIVPQSAVLQKDTLSPAGA